MSATFRSFESRNFRLFFAGQATSQIGSWMRMVALSLLVLDLTDSGLAVGLMTASQFGPVLVLGPWAGLVADRSDKRKLLLIAQTALMAQSFALAGLAAVGSPPVWALCAVAMAGGVATSFDNPARRSFVVEMVPETHVQNAVSLNTAMMTGSRIFGPALAGVLIVALGYAWTLLIDAVSYIAVLVGLWLMRTDELRPAPPAARGRGQVRAGLRYVRSMPDLFIPLVMMTVIGTLAFNFQVVLPLFVTRTLDGTKAEFTYLFSVLSAGSMVGALWSARRTVVRLRHIVVATGVFGVTMLGLAAAPSLAAAYPIGAVMGLASVVFMTTSTTMIQLRADPSMRGRVLALQAMVFLGSTPIGGPIVGGVSEAFGARAGLALGAFACLGAAVYGAIAGRRLLERGRVVRDDVVTPGAELQSAV